MVNLPCNGSLPKEAKAHAGLSDWEDFGSIIRQEPDGVFILQKDHDPGPGAEKGLVSRHAYTSVDLSFEVQIDSQACFIAKIHQSNQYDQLANSYHVLCHGSSDYFARHNHIFTRFRLNRNEWEKIRLVLHNGIITAYRNEQVLFSVHDRALVRGYSFLGIKGGQARIRNIRLKEPTSQAVAPAAGAAHGTGYQVLCDHRTAETPLVSIITTVYDRTDCLRNCIRSVRNLNFLNYEHVIVADCPPQGTLNVIRDVVAADKDGRTVLVNLTKRYNNWGIQPASVGLSLARGTYVCFLSDDNGYRPDHLDPLVDMLENDVHLGFAYSSCRYDGRLVLDSAVPHLGKIDLGQPLFRKALFDRYLGGKLPFKTIAWDWEMINTFMRKKVMWKHHNEATFFFRLKKYPSLAISLIHPSRGRAVWARETYMEWIKKSSKNPDIYIKHYLSLDCSDPKVSQYREQFNGTTCLVIQDNDGVVQATNSAAKIARGDLLVYLSDDFSCPPNWDLLLVKKLQQRNLNPGSDKFVIKVNDCLQDIRARVLTIPMMSRALFEYLRYFWHPEYKSMFADMDLFEVCSRLGVIVDAPELKFEHRHYSVGKSQKDETYLKSTAFWSQGQEVYNLRKARDFYLVPA